MKTFLRGRALHVIGWALALSVCLATSVGAQQSLEIPAPSSQAQPPVRYRPQPTPRPYTPPSNTVETLPQQNLAPPQPTPEAAPLPTPAPPQEARTAPMRPPSYQAEPVLPAVFRGCWQGQVSFLDAIKRLPGGPKVGVWTPKTYRLCYERIGSGPFTLTFTEAGMAHDRRVTNAQGRMQLLTTDGRTYATMRAFLHFDEYRTHMSYFGGSTFPVDEVTNLECNIEPDGMHVRGVVSGTHGGDPWFRAWWHTVFVHIGAPPVRGIPE